MELDGSLVLAEVGPREHGETQVDGGGAQGVDCVLQLQSKAVVYIEFSGRLNERTCKVGVNAPVSDLVGICQVVAGDRRADTHVIELALLCPQTGFDVPQALAIGQLGKGHAEILFEAGELLDLVVAVVAIDALMENMERKMLHHLR